MFAVARNKKILTPVGFIYAQAILTHELNSIVLLD
jgi:hypothetical protein